MGNARGKWGNGEWVLGVMGQNPAIGMYSPISIRNASKCK